VEIDSATEEHVTGLADELQELLTDNLVRDPAEAHLRMRKAAFVRAEIEACGFYVTWSAQLDPTTFAIDVEVTLLKPKDILADADRQIYEAWHAAAKVRFEHMRTSGQ
jgi:hypothetical protein